MVRLTEIDTNTTLGVVFQFFEIQSLNAEIIKLRDKLCVGDLRFQFEYPILFKFFEFAQAKAKYDIENAEYLLEQERENL